MTVANKIAAKINSLNEADAIDVYSALRIAVNAERMKKSDIASNLSQVMVMAGDALEARIGEDHFMQVLDAVDAQIYGAAAA